MVKLALRCHATACTRVERKVVLSDSPSHRMFGIFILEAGFVVSVIGVYVRAS